MAVDSIFGNEHDGHFSPCSPGVRSIVLLRYDSRLMNRNYLSVKVEVGQPEIKNGRDGKEEAWQTVGYSII